MKAILVGVALAGLLVLAACGGGDGDASSDAPARLPDDPCGLLTADEVGEVLREPVGAASGGGGRGALDEALGYRTAGCIYNSTVADSQRRVVIIAWTRVEGVEPSPDVPPDIGAFCDERSGAGTRDLQTIEELGERAYQNDTAGLFVLDGGVCFTIFASIADIQYDQAEEIEREFELELAAIAVERLHE